jgi:hypothetical protein
MCDQHDRQIWYVYVPKENISNIFIKYGEFKPTFCRNILNQSVWTPTEGKLEYRQVLLCLQPQETVWVKSDASCQIQHVHVNTYTKISYPTNNI